MNHASLENILHRAEYTLLGYKLRLLEDFELPAYGLLRLRRELNRLLNTGLIVDAEREELRQLLHPPRALDSEILRRTQQPAPGFVLQIDQLKAVSYEPGDMLSLNVCFFGRGIGQIKVFSGLLEILGEIGLTLNRGRFYLDSIENNCNLQSLPLWRSGPYLLTPQLLDLAELFVTHIPQKITLEFLTPARLLKNGRPLFKPDFTEVFPFLLRRVTGMCAIWAEVEDVFDVELLIQQAARVRTLANRFFWQDWRSLDRKEEVGGLMGKLTLEGDELLDLWPVLKIGELLGLGKGAAFGAGRYRLS
ncbi:CRISPR system precrRNA processing endoribonuclease RAMP protein Cas6 [Geopsychrobacter electrodiphilus]|uniref:CRISPR system precrRNA processing endoribonuclease RAMP protein Cas6 n=1 Tax=Geopsychrobacter electrodiphilus TaxID=225196 RepID=UPI000378D8C3|nr:CRISPR system precrRNA processing endoribonuclease RAMP protein Cas6 [Geopsychrobacter electrodiphilus]